MRWKISVLLIAAMLCVALTGVAAAEDIKCCWEKPCGTKVVQCDKETTFVLYPAPDAQIVMSTHGYWYVDMDSEDGDTISFGDIRLTWYHDNYPPNTKVLDDGDNGDIITVIPPQDIITYLDINNNDKFDLYDPVYIDLDNSGDVTKDDIRITDVPPVDVYDEEGNLMYTLGDGEWDEYKWTQVKGLTSENDYLWPLDEIGSGIASDLLGWMDGDCSGDWNCADKLYINQPTPQCQFDYFVTIGDVRLYVPPDECIPDCGTKVQQGEKDVVYALMVDTGAKIAYYTLDPKEIYIDMNDDGLVSFGDIRLTNVSTHYGPNTKVEECDYWDLGHVLEEFKDQEIIRYHDLDGLAGYTLGDPLYVDADDDDEVSDGDIRLTKVPPFDILDDDGNVVIPNGSYGLAWSVVKELPDDSDVGWVLDDLGTVNELLGYIDSDCSGDWTCPDKMYLQQLVDTPQHDLFVTIGDLRLYIPDETSPFYDPEWPECGTKVVQCNIDLVYALMDPWENDIYPTAGFVDKDGQQGFGLIDNAYLDMDENELVSKGDIRLTNVTIKYNKYEYNTKVVDHDEDIGNILNYDNGFDVCGCPIPFGIIFFVDLNQNGVYDVNDPLYLDSDWLGPGFGFGVTQGDIRLTDVPVFDGTPYGDVGAIGTAWSRVIAGDPDTNWEFFRGSISSLAEFSMIGDFIMIFDADCSGTWTCVDKLYLQQEVWWGHWWFNDNPACDCIAWYFVTVGDLRLYMPPCESTNGEEPIDEMKGDFEPDGDVDFTDFSAFAGVYNTQMGGLGPGDFDDDGDVDFTDFSAFAGVYSP